MSKEVNQRANQIEEWLGATGPNDLLKSMILAFASKMAQSSGSQAEEYYKLIKVLVEVLP
jgi:hypothetical protein